MSDKNFKYESVYHSSNYHTNFVSLGMCLQLLMYDLSHGVRLHCSKEYPPSIENILQRCFEENTEKRPDFSDIKNDIELAFCSLKKTRMREPSISSNKIGKTFFADDENYLSVFKTNEFDDPMKKKYQLIQKQNANNIGDKSVMAKSQSSLKYANLDFDIEMRPSQIQRQQKQSLLLSNRFNSVPGKLAKMTRQDIRNPQFTQSCKD